MTLIDAILKAKSTDDGKYSSPPPEVEEIMPVKFKRVHKYAHVRARVDSAPPRLNPYKKMLNLESWRQDFEQMFIQNIYMLTLIRKAHFTGGWVDSHWSVMPPRSRQYFQNRVDFLKRVYNSNQALYRRIKNTKARILSTSELNREWVRNRRKIVAQASGAFVLFPPEPREEMEDLAFLPLPTVTRPRVYIKLAVKDGAILGELCIELFTDMCPNTCEMFLELLDGDTLGHGYVGTCFFRKIPQLYWSGGDVIYNSGFGCYVQRGRVIPIGAENYHFPHSMPGLVSMRMTQDDEMCGIFNMTFKPLPQLDLRNVVFGRIIRPCTTYDMISGLGNALSTRPIVEVRATRRKVNGRWVTGEYNSRLATRTTECLRRKLIKK